MAPAVAIILPTRGPLSRSESLGSDNGHHVNALQDERQP